MKNYILLIVLIGLTACQESNQQLSSNEDLENITMDVDLVSREAAPTESKNDIENYMNDANKVIEALKTYCESKKCLDQEEIAKQIVDHAKQKQANYESMMEECADCDESFSMTIAYKNDNYIVIESETDGMYGGAYPVSEYQQMIFHLQNGRIDNISSLVAADKQTELLKYLNVVYNVSKVEAIKCLEENNELLDIKIEASHLSRMQIQEDMIYMDLELLPHVIQACEPTISVKIENVKAFFSADFLN